MRAARRAYAGSDGFIARRGRRSMRSFARSAAASLRSAAAGLTDEPTAYETTPRDRGRGRGGRGARVGCYEAGPERVAICDIGRVLATG